ncbi:helix-turn-helix domain-containing protein [Streptomyces sp. NPDC000880]
MTQKAWPDELAAVIAGELRRYRKAQKMSAQALADACTDLGLPIQRSVIANFESGRRTSIGVAELLVMAAALRVPPIALIFPMGHEESMRPLPQTTWDPYMAAEWFTGEALITRWPREAGPIRMARRLHEQLAELGSARLVRGQFPPLNEVAEEVERLVLLNQAAQYEYSRVREREERYRALAQELAHRQAGPGADLEDEREEARRSSLMLADLGTQARAVLMRTEHDLAKAKRQLGEVKAADDMVRANEDRVVETLVHFKENGFLPPELPDPSRHLLEVADRVFEEQQVKSRESRAQYSQEPAVRNLRDGRSSTPPSGEDDA